MRSPFAVAALAVMILGAAPAFAGRKTFFVDPQSVRTANGASRNLGTGGLAGIALSDSGSPDFGFGFIIPKGYKRNSPIRIIFVWETADTGCAIRLEPEFLDRVRAGHPSTASFGAFEGLAAENGVLDLTVPAVALEGALKTYTLSPGQGFDQVTGDAINVAFVRNSSHPNDTCVDDLIISGILVEYQTP